MNRRVQPALGFIEAMASSEDEIGDAEQLALQP